MHSGCGRDASSGAAPHASGIGAPILPLPQGEALQGPPNIFRGDRGPGLPPACVSSGLSLGLLEPRFSHLRWGKAQRVPSGWNEKAVLLWQRSGEEEGSHPGHFRLQMWSLFQTPDVQPGPSPQPHICTWPRAFPGVPPCPGLTSGATPNESGGAESICPFCG